MTVRPPGRTAEVRPEAALTVSSYRVPGRGQSFLRLEGYLGQTELVGLRATLDEALQGEPHDLVVDMHDVWGVSVETLALLVGARTRQRALGRQLTLVLGASSATDEALDAAGLRGRFHVVREVSRTRAL